MEVGESSCGNEGVWMNRYLLVCLLTPSFDPAADLVVPVADWSC